MSRVGISNPHAIHNQPVIIQTNENKIRGILFLSNQREPYIDVGLNSKSSVESLDIFAGDPVNFDNPLVELENTSSKHIVCGAGLDNKIGLTIWLQILERLNFSSLPFGFYFIATSMEEWGQKGIQTALSGLDPNLAIILDVTWEVHPIYIGNGPVITLMDRGIILPRKFREFLRQLGEKLKIPIQFEVMEDGTSEAMNTTTYSKGIPTICPLVATKNPHTSKEIAEIRDIENTIQLTMALIRNTAKILQII